MKSLIIVFVVVLSTIVASTIAFDYCSICNQQHIACNNTGEFGASCPVNRSVIPMTEDLIALILKKHNTVRMNIANGKNSNFTTANRMIEMSWDNEFAIFAEMNAKKCIFAHDQCINTDVYKYAGQNIAITSSSPNETYAINQLFDLWYDEYVLCNMTYINKVTGYGAIGHFTQIIMANASKIGCAMVKFNSKWYFVCNYSQTNVLSWPVYITGTPCSGCKSGCSTNYPGLCNVNEIV